MMKNKGKITREELLTSPEYVLGNIQLDLYREISEYLKRTKKSRTDFAKDLKVSKGYVSQILNGDFNHKLEKFVQLSLSIGRIPVVKFEEVEAYLSQKSDKHEKLELRSVVLDPLHIKKTLYLDRDDPPEKRMAFRHLIKLREENGYTEERARVQIQT